MAKSTLQMNFQSIYENAAYVISLHVPTRHNKTV